MIELEVLLEFGPALCVSFAQWADTRLSADIFDAGVDDGEDDNGHVASKHEDKEVPKLKVDLYAHDIEGREDVAREKG